ncbi:hypothetical protein, partial [Salibacterium salarium]|uniref:hypothetical protein n=1 Tax=Salibacterium salarium TaxID=284579 RepID=UPI001C8C4936
MGNDARDYNRCQNCAVPVLPRISKIHSGKKNPGEQTAAKNGVELTKELKQLNRVVSFRLKRSQQKLLHPYKMPTFYS